MPSGEFKTLLATFADVFPHATLWFANHWRDGLRVARRAAACLPDNLAARALLRRARGADAVTRRRLRRPGAAR